MDFLAGGWAEPRRRIEHYYYYFLNGWNRKCKRWEIFKDYSFSKRILVRQYVWGGDEDIKDFAKVLLLRTRMLNSFFIKTKRPHGQAHIACVCVHMCMWCLSLLCDQSLLIKCCHFPRCDTWWLNWMARHGCYDSRQRNLGFCPTHTALWWHRLTSSLRV